MAATPSPIIPELPIIRAQGEGDQRATFFELFFDLVYVFAVMARKHKLFQNPLCEKCGTQVAVEVDHVVPLDQDGDFAPENLSALCSPCHWAKTGRENRESVQRKARS